MAYGLEKYHRIGMDEFTFCVRVDKLDVGKVVEIEVLIE